MIGWIKGKKIDYWKNRNKQGILIDCSGLGYEVQILSRQIPNINLSQEIVLWIHQIYRDEGYTLFGFMEGEERNLFRLLISVNGIGPQMGISLLENFEFHDLISAIRNQDLKKLSTAQGVGKRIAERLTVELKNKFDKSFENGQFSKIQDITTKHQPDRKERKVNELISTLKMLGYEDVEIQEAINEVIGTPERDLSSSTLLKDDFEVWLKESIKWLSQEIA